MGRRFPPPLFGVERTKRRSEAFVELAIETDGELDKSAFVEQARERLRKPDDGSRYSVPYLRRIVSTYAQLGVLRQRSDGSLTVWQFGRDWHAGEIDFETFLWYGIKREWVLEGGFPEGIDGLRSIHQILLNTDEALGKAELERILTEEHDYEFNDQKSRGYPTLLTKLGAARQTADGYVATEPASRWQSRFRNADLLPTFERWLKQEGAHVEPPSDTVKRDLAKYYIYRESGGHGRHRQLFDTFRRDYLKSTAYENDVSQPTIRRADKYVAAEKNREALRDEIREQFPSFTGDRLAGLSTDVLERIAAADDPAEAYRIKSTSGAGLSRADFEQWAGADRAPYSFPDHFELYDWQQEAATQWFTPPAGARDHGIERGIARVVTGAGKTVMALEVVRRWLAEHPDGVVTILVPTKVLMHQWLEELVEKLNVPADDVGWAGGGHKDGFEDDHRILVSIVNSAVKDNFLGDSLATTGVEEHLLVADECHRYTGETFSNVFEYPRTASLGLSATPLSDPGDDEQSESDEMLLSELGEIYYELTYDEGITRNLIPEFKVRYVGFELTDAERTTYDRLTEKVTDAISDIEARYANQIYDRSGSFSQKLQAIASSIDGPTPAISDFFRYTQERRDLVADAIGRQAISLSLLRESVEESRKTIVFQERIKQLERMVASAESRGRNNRTGAVADEYGDRQQLYEQYPGLEKADKALEDLFFNPNYQPVMYHSGHRSDAWNDFAVEWFDDDGFANVMLSVKALIEGVDVPSADVGIVRVSSGSVRQRIQTLGRVLRTGGDPSSTSELYVLYARDTVDEKIFQDYDWDEQLSTADVSHLTWDPEGDWEVGDWDPETPFHECVREATNEELPDPSTRRPVPDESDLTVGELYPGPRDGYRFSVDADGQPFEKSADGRRYIRHDTAEEIANTVHDRNGGGTVIVNEANHALMFDDGDAVFLGVVDPGDFDYTTAESDSVLGTIDDSELDEML
ncbi:DEAD/DEAH box helicase [Halobacterium salinarum]|uniref:DEAD/DEAH box helicase n=1 Tax=Halobacterium salinarum TaxID=2242 RepID=UPI002557B4A5|nr:DEAD/DEAH box helicase family protein [Halobacterium salinarum]MDL0134056.1 DEAD/DEAH box helicase family protein [Halobacterium salinarum]